MIGEKVKALRKERGWTLEELAKITGCAKAHIWSLEAGKTPNPSAEWLFRVSKAFGVTIEYLIENTPKKESQDDAFYSMYLSLPDETKRQIREIGLILKNTSKS